MAATAGSITSDKRGAGRPATATSTARPPRRRRLTRRARRELFYGLAFISPWLIGVIVLQAYPLLMTVYYSFTNFTGLNFPPGWVGFANFRMAFSQPDFWTAVRNTIWWVAISVPATLIIGLALAVLVNRAWKGMGVFRTLIYLPSMFPYIGAGIVFAWVFNPASGPINAILGFAHIPQPGWFISPAWAKPGLVLLSLWQVGPVMIIFLAGLQAIPTDVVEAAIVDGANRWRRFRSVVLPLLTPTVFFNVVLGMIGAFSLFTQAVAVSAAAGNTGGQTGSALLGNPNNSLLFYPVYIYEQTFQNFNFGVGAAMSLLLTGVVALMAALLFLSARRWVYYPTEPAGR
jgi:multiple sugar transport system permease protein